MTTKNLKVIVNFETETDSNLLTKTDLILTGMLGNTNFVTPTPSVAALQTARDNYNNGLLAAGSGNHTAIAEKNGFRKVLETDLGTMGNYINSLARGNEAALKSTLFPTTKEPEPGYLGVVEFMKLSPGVNAGTLVCQLKRVKNGKSYTFMITEDPLSADSLWTSFVSTSCKHSFDKLEPGRKYWVKVIVAGTRGQSTQSGPISQYALS
ncbi:hypothetical protein BH11BAC6_BH11BAC6_17130 [soil metagenome]